MHDCCEQDNSMAKALVNYPTGLENTLNIPLSIHYLRLIYIKYTQLYFWFPHHLVRKYAVYIVYNIKLAEDFWLRYFKI